MKNIFKTIFFIVVGVFNSCSNDNDGIIGEDTNTGINEIKIGDEHQRGIVYYILKEEDKDYISGETHGLIASFEEIKGGENEFFWWYCWEDVSIPYNSEFIGGDGKDIGDGKENISKIINYCNNISGVLTMAHICDSYEIEYEGILYDDWFLPSRSEVIEMINQHDPLPLVETLTSENPNVLELDMEMAIQHLRRHQMVITTFNRCGSMHLI